MKSKKMDLRVKIPKKYKQSLDDRFNPDRAVWDSDEEHYVIYSDGCLLCKDYSIEFMQGDYCSGSCPFKKYQTPKDWGCVVWINEIIGYEVYFSSTYDGLEWNKQNNKRARKQLKKLRRKAKKLIEWI